MSKSNRSNQGPRIASHVEIKSKFEAEFRRFSIERTAKPNFEEFQKLLEKLHSVENIPFYISYTDPKDGDLLPINNDDNFNIALQNSRPLLRIFLQRQGNSQTDLLNGSTIQLNKKLNLFFTPRQKPPQHALTISKPQDFRQVSAIIDVDIVPETCRRVKLLKHKNSDKPLGFYIRDGTSIRVTPQGLEKVPGIFISRLVPGGLAESTGLLGVNDEVLEVNGIEVAGKTLDQVTDMMVVNSSNLIVTVRPASSQYLTPRRGSLTRTSQMSAGSQISASSQQSTGSDDDKNDQDEIRDLTGGQHDESITSHPHHLHDYGLTRHQGAHAVVAAAVVGTNPNDELHL